MARIVQKRKKLEEKYRQYRLRGMIGLICGAAGFLSFAVGAFSLGAVLFVPCAALMIGGTLFGGYALSKAAGYKKGMQGEAVTAGILAELPEEYVGFLNLEMEYQGKSSELDMTVVGPTGVFVIETKNMGGAVFGHCESPTWTQRKTGQQGTPYTRNFYNPVKQVNTQAARLAGWLKSNGFSVAVRDLVYFSDPETVIQLKGQENCQTPVLTALMNPPGELKEWILTGDRVLSDEDCAKIVALLEAR